MALGFGGSLISIFARLGGGIFTKGADVGADLVGKVEVGIPEDDPRNPATIADNVGDNVGDCAGMAADLFETYVGDGRRHHGARLDLLRRSGRASSSAMIYPLAIGGLSHRHVDRRHLFREARRRRLRNGASSPRPISRSSASTIRSWARSTRASIAAGVLSIGGLFLATTFTVGWGEIGKANGEAIHGYGLFLSGVLGLLVTGLIVYITEYYTGTGKRPVVSIAQASVTGHGTNVIQGLAVSLESTAAPALVIVLGIILDL